MVGLLSPTTRLEPSDTTSKALHAHTGRSRKRKRKSKESSRQEEMAKPAMSSTPKKSMMISVAMLLLFAPRKSIGGEVVVQMGCSGKLGDCLWEKGEEMEMESETSRRVLWAAHKKYISYEALKRDVVPCSKPGVPYYNCRALPKASPYRRGCEAISECRGG